MQFFQKPYFAFLASFLVGAICALSMAPYDFWLVFILGFGALYFLIDHASSNRKAFVCGWLWAFGYFVFSLYWIGNALLVEGNPYKWAYPLAVCGLPSLLALFHGVSAYLIKRFCDLKHWTGYLGFVGIIAAFEWLRGHFFTGFPWNLFGYSWAGFDKIAQFAAFDSVYLLTLATVFWLSFGGFIFVSHAHRAKITLGAFVAVSFLSVLGFGHLRLQNKTEFRDEVIKIVQPNTPQHEKWERDKMQGHFETALSLSQSTNDDVEKTIIVWPETTLSPAFLNSPQKRFDISSMLNGHQNEAVLLTGALRYEQEAQTYHNSLISIDSKGVIDRIYDKTHLVPFGEYIPFQKWIPLTPVVQFQGFEKGKGLKDFDLFDDLKYSPLICYEVIFPKKSIKKSSRADLIVNITNDAWYGNSPGPYQHLTISRFRAIEEGLPLIRAANTGVSAIFDSYGREVHTTAIFNKAVFSSQIPKKNKKTLLFSYTYFQLHTIFILLFTTLAFSYKYICRCKK